MYIPKNVCQKHENMSIIKVNEKILREKTFTICLG